jgi:accessory gene regulator protein AgrB
MYVFIWRRLPGGLPGKIVGSLVLLCAALALLFYVVFPWVEPRLPFNQVTVPHESPTGGP